MSRDAEKLLMKELEQAVRELDKHQEAANTAHDAYKATLASLQRSQEEVDAISTAIAAIRRTAGDTGRRQIVGEAREKTKKEKPVA